MFYLGGMGGSQDRGADSNRRGERLFELRRRTFDTPEFRGIEFIEVECKTILNRVPGDGLPFNWTINPYRGCTHACSYCFARATHPYLDLGAGRDFETKILVKINAPEVLRAQLRSRRWKGEHVAMGTGTDPYQRAEGRYRLMPQLLEALIERRNPFSILTKGVLILRDLPMLERAAAVAEISTAFSIATLDEDVWRRAEPGTPHPRERMRAVRALNEAGIPCGVMLAPVMPGINDRPEQLRAVVEAAIDAGATHVSPILLHLRPTVREEYLAWLHAEYPDLVARHEAMYRRGAYAPRADRAKLAEDVGGLVAELGGVPDARPRRARREPAAAPEQLTLL